MTYRPRDTELRSILGMMKKFQQITNQKGSRPERLGENIRKHYLNLSKIPIQEFSHGLWDEVDEKYHSLF